MISPARAHFMRVSAQHLANEQGAEQHHTGRTAYEQQLAQLVDHRRRLKDIQSIERKIELKRQLLPEYLPWIEGVLQGGKGNPDEVFVTGLTWALDVQDWPLAVRMADYALKHKLPLPDRFARTLGTLIAEETADAALAPDATVPVDTLIEVDLLTRGEDMPDQVRAKLRKAIGKAFRASGNPVEALEYLKQALSLDSKTGVKKDIEQLERELKKQQAGSDAGTTNTATGQEPEA